MLARSGRYQQRSSANADAFYRVLLRHQDGACAGKRDVGAGEGVMIGKRMAGRRDARARATMSKNRCGLPMPETAWTSMPLPLRGIRGEARPASGCATAAARASSRFRGRSIADWRRRVARHQAHDRIDAAQARDRLPQRAGRQHEAVAEFARRVDHGDFHRCAPARNAAGHRRRRSRRTPDGCEAVRARPPRGRARSTREGPPRRSSGGSSPTTLGSSPASHGARRDVAAAIAAADDPRRAVRAAPTARPARASTASCRRRRR